MAKMSDKTKRAINAGRRRAGLKPIRFSTPASRKTKLSKTGKRIVMDRKPKSKTGKIKKSGIGNW